jgi:hypothetical protein
VTVALDQEAALLAARLRQAALGCTVHGHGPLNAIAAILRAHERGEVDGVAIFERVAELSSVRLQVLDPDAVEAARERKVAQLCRVLARGLELA